MRIKVINKGAHAYAYSALCIAIRSNPALHSPVKDPSSWSGGLVTLLKSKDLKKCCFAFGFAAGMLDQAIVTFLSFK